MKIKNKKTGEIIDLLEGDLRGVRFGEQIVVKPVAALDKEYIYNSLAELCEEWEDYKEPKKFWCIIDNGNIAVSNDTDEDVEASKQIGNYFETKEEAEKAVEKLKAWKRLKDKGFRFTGWEEMRYDEEKNMSGMNIYGDMPIGEVTSELDILFGGEE